MNKKALPLLISLAFASGAALAGEVQIFGQVDSYIAINDNGGDKEVRLGSGAASASHWGLQGSEAVSDKVTALFKLDSAFYTDSGTWPEGAEGIFNRESWVGLSHADWGTISFGRQYTPHFLTFAMTDPTDLSLGSSHSPFFFPSPTGVNGDAGDSLVRHSNSILYVSPNLKGATIFAYAAFGEESNSSSRGNVYNLAVNYASGPLFVMASVLRQDYSGDGVINAGYTLDGTINPDVAPQAKGEGWYYNIGATYDFGVTKPSVLFMKKTVSCDADPEVPELPEFWIMQIGTATPIFGGRWSVSAAMLHNETEDDADAWSFGTRFDYPLSKRTKVYVGFETVINDDNAKYSIEAGPDSSLHFANDPGVDQRQLFFGVNHSF